MPSSTLSRPVLFVLLVLGLVTVDAADPKLSRQQADAFLKKVTTINTPKTAPRRTPVSEAEVNSWFVYSAAPLLPTGLAEPSLSLVGEGKVGGKVTVDLDRVAKKKSSGGTLDPWSYIGGRVPLTVMGRLHTKDGKGRFELESAQLGSLPVPKFLIQELLTSYSRTPENPDGFSLDDTFPLPSKIDRIEVGAGQAVVVQ